MKYARECSVTGEGMNAGWVFGDGTFYAKYEKDALAECRKDRDAILRDVDTLTSEDIQDPTAWWEFAYARGRAMAGMDDDHDLMTIAFQTDYAYYTEWEDQDDYQYEEVEPCDECGYVDDAVASHYEECSKLNTNE